MRFDETEEGETLDEIVRATIKRRTGRAEPPLGVVHRLEHYTPAHLAQIVERSARILGVDIEAGGAATIERGASGTAAGATAAAESREGTSTGVAGAGDPAGATGAGDAGGPTGGGDAGGAAALGAG